MVSVYVFFARQRTAYDMVISDWSSDVGSAELDKMWVTANFKETQLTLMRVGQPVSIKIDAFPDVATGNFVKVVQRVPVRIVFDTKNAPDPRDYPIGPG